MASGKKLIAPDLFTSAARLQNRLAELGFPSAVIGGLAISIWGDPRVTRDADLKVLVSREQANDLLAAVGSRYTVVQSQPIEAIRRFGYVFVQDEFKNRIDLLFTDTSFDETVIRRALRIKVLPRIYLNFCTAEDLIVYKMLSTRERDIGDVRSVIQRQGDKLDDTYIFDWLRQFEQALDDSTLVSTYRRLRGK